MPYSEAKSQFNQHLINVTDAQKNAKTHELTVGGVMDLFLDWIEKRRSERTYSTRKTHCTRFGKSRIKGIKIGDLPARRFLGSDLEAWLEHLPRLDLLRRDAGRRAWVAGAVVAP